MPTTAVHPLTCQADVVVNELKTFDRIALINWANAAPGALPLSTEIELYFGVVEVKEEEVAKWGPSNFRGSLF